MDTETRSSLNSKSFLYTIRPMHLSDEPYFFIFFLIFLYFSFVMRSVKHLRKLNMILYRKIFRCTKNMVSLWQSCDWIKKCVEHKMAFRGRNLAVLPQNHYNSGKKTIRNMGKAKAINHYFRPWTYPFGAKKWWKWAENGWVLICIKVSFTSCVKVNGRIWTVQ